MKALICYDGSADARAAIIGAGRLLPGSDVTVLVIWETTLETMTRVGALGAGFAPTGPYGDDGTDAAVEQQAVDTASDGAQCAKDVGLVAHPRIVNRRDAIAIDILATASEEDADVVVLGTRGRGGMKSMMLGSESAAVLHHADRPVLVIPSPVLVGERHEWAAHAELISGASTANRTEKELNGAPN
jgi:nucleotide-binding universal stress UspA family protein